MRPNPHVVWYVVGTIAAATIGWLSARIHASGHAPIGLTSLGVGIALGASLSALAARLRLAGRPSLIIGTAILAILTILAEHAWLYRDFCGQWQEARAKSPQVALFRAESPPPAREYFARELPANGTLWAADAAMIVAAAVVVVVVSQRNRK